MLYDFLMLELYFGFPEAAQYIEDAIRKYGWPALRDAISNGWLETRAVELGPEKGRALCWLSASGREAAQSSL